MSKNKQLDAMLHKHQLRFRHTRHNWKQFERIMADIGMDAKSIQIAELAALQCGLVSKNIAPRKVLGVGKNDIGLDGEISLPMPGGNGRLILPKSPFRLMQRVAARAERGYMLKSGLVRRLGMWFKTR